LRYWKVPLELGGGPGEEHGPISKNWGYSGVEIGFKEESME